MENLKEIILYFAYYAKWHSCMFGIQMFPIFKLNLIKAIEQVQKYVFCIPSVYVSYTFIIQKESSTIPEENLNKIPIIIR